MSESVDVKKAPKQSSKSKDTKAKPAENQQKLKILMIHGYKQSMLSFREKTGSLRKFLKSHADFVFCEAPNKIPKREEAKNDEVSGDSAQKNLDPEAKLSDLTIQEDQERGWWFSEIDKNEKKLSYDAWDITDCDIGFEDSLNYLNEVFEKEGPFDGVFSFSQGASLTSIMCKISSENCSKENTDENQKFKFIKFKFAVLVAGFKSGQTMHNHYYELNNKINIPTLHLIGTGDKVIPSEMALKLVDYFVDPKIHIHEGGHFIPVNAESKNAYTQFLIEMKQKIFS